MMVRGIPCSLTTSLMYNFASYSAIKVTLGAKKWAALVRRSTTTQIASWCLLVLGNPTIESMVICSHFHTGMGNNCEKPPSFWCSVLTHWKVRQQAPQSAMSFSSQSTRNGALSPDTSLYFWDEPPELNHGLP